MVDHFKVQTTVGWVSQIPSGVTTLALGLRPKQGLAKVQAKNET
jgi:hypothetical protein